MTDTASLERRIDRIESRFAIQELVTAYCEACDEHDMPRLAGLFTEDAVFDSPSGVLARRGPRRHRGDVRRGVPRPGPRVSLDARPDGRFRRLRPGLALPGSSRATRRRS